MMKLVIILIVLLPVSFAAY
ncbi:type I toxin-antitoxin system Ibs family toxin [Escherichia coli]|nr:type I toxin-antitoxin system Ibs family toxin [Escherichia coli]EFI4431749.1 type I toxin-antitoxin system Ibs family toxin [Escherichia coli]EGJ2785873.1 type I toxin-antitoxin system Ibs family toxin [Escherichia coli]HAX1570246.1 type I toxin-antitoxin system Ibs family toxin [Escherichia coli]HBQ4789437.1 type I toxin-antitoxin system Ibs family toxin [Escherichia coli]